MFVGIPYAKYGTANGMIAQIKSNMTSLITCKSRSPVLINLFAVNVRLYITTVKILESTTYNTQKSKVNQYGNIHV